MKIPRVTWRRGWQSLLPDSHRQEGRPWAPRHGRAPRHGKEAPRTGSTHPARRRSKLLFHNSRYANSESGLGVGRSGSSEGRMTASPHRHGGRIDGVVVTFATLAAYDSINVGAWSRRKSRASWSSVKVRRRRSWQFARRSFAVALIVQRRGAHPAHWPRDRPSGDHDPVPDPLTSDPARAVDANVGLEHGLDLDHQGRIAAGTKQNCFGTSPSRHARAVGRRGDRQNPADRFDPGGLADSITRLRRQCRRAAP